MCWNKTKLVLSRLQKLRLQGREILSNHNCNTIDVRDHRRKLQKVSNLKRKKEKERSKTQQETILTFLICPMCEEIRAAFPRSLMKEEASSCFHSDFRVFNSMKVHFWFGSHILLVKVKRGILKRVVSKCPLSCAPCWGVRLMPG